MDKKANPGEAPSGFTWRVVLGLIYGAIVLTPAGIWLFWSAGVAQGTTGAAAQISVLLLFTTLASATGSPFSKQESFVMYSNMMSVIGETMAPALVFQYYIRSSPAAHALGLSHLIPNWYAPPPGSINRTMFDVNWVPLIVVYLLMNVLFIKALDLSIGYLVYQLYAVEEKLPYPGTRVWAETCITIAEKMKRPKKAKLLTYTAVIGMIFTALTHGIVIITGSPLIPVWNDMTYMLETALPGASLGIIVDLLVFSGGFIMPWHVAVSILIGGVAAFIVANPILVKMGQFPTYKLGMGSWLIWWRSRIDFWMSPMIGIGIAAGIIPLIRGRRYVVGALRRLTVAGKTSTDGGIERRPISLLIIIGLFLLGALGSAVLTMILAPDLPIWIPIVLSTGWTFLYALINGRANAEASVNFSVPYLKEGTFYAVGYQGVNAWFAPLIVGGGLAGAAGGTWGAVYLACDLTETKFSDYFKAYFLAFPIAMAISFFYVEAFWKMAPIPSAAYPYTAADWPVEASFTLLWPGLRLTGFRLIRPDLIFGSLIIGAIVSASCGFLNIPFELIGFAIGMSQLMHFTVTTFLGGVFGRIMERRMGKEWWRDNLAVVAAGLGIGEGVLIAVVASIALISRSMWIWPV